MFKQKKTKALRTLEEDKKQEREEKDIEEREEEEEGGAVADPAAYFLWSYPNPTPGMTSQGLVDLMNTMSYVRNALVEKGQAEAFEKDLKELVEKWHPSEHHRHHHHENGSGERGSSGSGDSRSSGGESSGGGSSSSSSSSSSSAASDEQLKSSGNQPGSFSLPWICNAAVLRPLPSA